MPRTSPDPAAADPAPEEKEAAPRRAEMHRIFLGMAITDGTLLLATFALGFTALDGRRGPGSWYTIHFLFGLFTTMATLLVHSIAFTYFLGTGRWVKEVAHVYRLPDWVAAQAAKNKRRAFPFELWGMLLIGATAWLGAGADRLGWPPALHLGLAALALAFNLGAFAAEYAMIVAQARLLLEVKDQADRIRESSLVPRPSSLGAEGGEAHEDRIDPAEIASRPRDDDRPGGH